MKFKIGIVLIILQVIAVFGAISNGSLATMGGARLIGFFIPAIIGVSLIAASKKQDQ